MLITLRPLIFVMVSPNPDLNHRDPQFSGFMGLSDTLITTVRSLPSESNVQIYSDFSF